MLVLIVKDSATKIPREVAGQAEVDAFRAAGFEVEVPADDQAQAAPADAPAADAEAAPQEQAAPAAKASKRKG